MTGTTSREFLSTKAIAVWRLENEPDTRSAAYAQADQDWAFADGCSPRRRSRVDNWVRTLGAYEQFWLEIGRTPRENTRNRASLPASERRLGEWARYQRRFEDNLCRYQEIRLDVSPAFVWDPHHAGWQQNVEACIRHVQESGQLPFLNAADPIEFALARWLGRQLRHLKTGTLLPERAAKLSELLTVRNRLIDTDWN
jgi:hypothetical protein